MQINMLSVWKASSICLQWPWNTRFTIIYNIEIVTAYNRLEYDKVHGASIG